MTFRQIPHDLPHEISGGFYFAILTLQQPGGSKMKHISEKNDWFYEWRPYFFIAFGLAGMGTRGLLAGHSGLGFLSFVCSLILIGAGAFVISMRKDYRKSSTWMK